MLARMRTWAERVEDDSEEQKDVLNQQILDTYDQLERYQSWEGIKALLEEEQRKAFTDIMTAEGESILLARERAKVIARLLRRPQDLQDQLERLHAERNSLEE